MTIPKVTSCSFAALFTLASGLAPAAELWENIDEIEPAGWRSSDWFGDFFAFDEGEGWIFHNEHGWAYATGSETTDFYLWQRQLGWVWTSEGSYPFLYVFDMNTWVWYDGSSAPPRKFTNMATGHIVDDTVMGGRAPNSINGKTIFLDPRSFETLKRLEGGTTDGFRSVEDDDLRGFGKLDDDGMPGAEGMVPLERIEFDMQGNGATWEGTGDGLEAAFGVPFERSRWDYGFSKLSPHEIEVLMPIEADGGPPTFVNVVLGFLSPRAGIAVPPDGAGAPFLFEVFDTAKLGEEYGRGWAPLTLEGLAVYVGDSPAKAADHDIWTEYGGDGHGTGSAPGPGPDVELGLYSLNRKPNEMEVIFADVVSPAPYREVLTFFSPGKGEIRRYDLATDALESTRFFEIDAPLFGGIIALP